jgi:hypothetical protein
MQRETKERKAKDVPWRRPLAATSTHFSGQVHFAPNGQGLDFYLFFIFMLQKDGGPTQPLKRRVRMNGETPVYEFITFNKSAVSLNQCGSATQSNKVVTGSSHDETRQATNSYPAQVSRIGCGCCNVQAFDMTWLLP